MRVLPLRSPSESKVLKVPAPTRSICISRLSMVKSIEYSISLWTGMMGLREIASAATASAHAGRVRKAIRCDALLLSCRNPFADRFLKQKLHFARSLERLFNQRRSPA